MGAVFALHRKHVYSHVFRNGRAFDFCFRRGVSVGERRFARLKMDFFDCCAFADVCGNGHCDSQFHHHLRAQHKQLALGDYFARFFRVARTLSDETIHGTNPGLAHRIRTHRRRKRIQNLLANRHAERKTRVAHADYFEFSRLVGEYGRSFSSQRRTQAALLRDEPNRRRRNRSRRRGRSRDVYYDDCARYVFCYRAESDD